MKISKRCFFLVESYKLIKIFVNDQRSKNSQDTPNEGEVNRGIHLTFFKNCLKSIVIRTMWYTPLENNREPRKQISVEEAPLQRPSVPAQHCHVSTKYISIVFWPFYGFGPILSSSWPIFIKRLLL